MVAPALLIDRLQLLSPRRTGGGTWEYSAKVAFADRRMRYSWGESYATEQALATDAALKALIGLPLIDEKHHRPGEPVDIEANGIPILGVIVDASWDPVERAQVVRLNVTDSALIKRLRRKEAVELSMAYVADMGEPDEDGALPQLARDPNHLAIVDAGRMPGTAFVVDSNHEQGGSIMTQEQIEAAMREAARKVFAEHAATERERQLLTDKAGQALAAEKARADKAEAALSSVLQRIGAKDADDIDRAARALLADAVDADVRRLEVARKLGVKLPEGSTPATRLADLLKAAELPAMLADSTEHADALLKALADKAPERTGGPEFVATHTGGSRRLTF